MKEMIRQRMKKLHRGNSSSASDKSGDGDRIDFKFSSFHALQVPKGWDKLSVSLFSVETGKTITKTGRASVWNGNCRWTETLSERVWVHDDSKELEQSLYKLLVSMGSARSGILGEVTINLASHMNSPASAPISLPLENCNHGTILQVQVQCLTPKATLRRKDPDSLTEDANADYNDIDNKSDVSDGQFTKSEGSSSSNFFSASNPGEPGSRGTSFSGVGSHRSFDSMEDSLARESYSLKINASGILNKDSTGSQKSTPHSSYNVPNTPKSSHSAYNSGISGSGKHLNNQREDSGHGSHAIAASPLRNDSRSEFVPDAEGVAFEELKAEARMWERNARKASLDLEFSKTELRNQAKDMANLEMELSASQTECDGLKQEVKQLKKLLNEATLKQEAAENLKLQVRDRNDNQREMEEEIRFLKESNDNLSLQLNKTQESNLELVSVLQELEEMIEKQKMEIESLSALRPESDLLAPVEENDKLNFEIQLKEFQESQKNLENTIRCLEKTPEDKNLEMKHERDLSSRTLMDCESEWRNRLILKEKEILNLEAKLSETLTTHDSMATDTEARGNLDLIEEINDLKEKIQELERDCNELTEENLELLFKLKELSKDLSTSGTSVSSSPHDRLTDVSPSSSGSEASKLEFQIWQLKEERKKRELDGVGTDNIQTRCNDLEKKCTDLELQLQTFKDKASFLDGELEISQARAEEQEIKISALKQQLQCLHRGRLENTTSQEEKSELVGENLIQLNKSLETIPGAHEVKITPVRDGYKVVNEMGINDMEEVISCLSNRELKGSDQKVKSRVEDLDEELLLRCSEIEELKIECMLKEQEIEARKCNQRDLETEISDLQKIITQMEEKLQTMAKEGKITSDCLDKLRSDMLVLSCSKDNNISANKILESKLEELVICKQELEFSLSELEQENVHLSDRISGLEAQLKYLTDAKESSRLEVQQSESHVMNLKGEIRKLENEMETQKNDLREKLQEIQQRLLEAQEECEYLKKENPKLQATIESLSEECSLLQQSNGEITQQRVDLHNKCIVLEEKLRESEHNFSDCSKKMENLEDKFSSMVEEMASKEKVLDAELDALRVQNMEYQEKLVLGESLLSQMYAEKVAEVQNLQQEVSRLSDQISATHDERDKIASEAVLEMHLLRTNKENLEAALEEIQGKFESSEKKLGTIKMEHEANLEELTRELADSKQNYELAVANHEKVTELLGNTRSNEEKLKTTIDELDSKLMSSQYEKLKLAEEITSLKSQLQTITLLQDEVLALKNMFNQTKIENQKLEASLESVSGDYEELKNEKILLLEKTSSMQKLALELEDFKRSKVSLEEKILRLEEDLAAREALSAQDSELKNDLEQIKRTNSQLQLKIECLQVEKEESLKKIEALKEDLEQKKHAEDGQTGTATDQLEQTKRSEVSIDTDGILEDSTQVNRLDNNSGSSQEMTTDTLLRIQSLEIELAEALEANDMYKSQLKSLLSEKEIFGKSKEAPEAINKEENKQKVSSLEVELAELRERYLEMSLKYAEVEAQREQLVLKLKSESKGKSWF